jgi:hypothetical protein
LTECSDISEVEAEETETVVVTVKMAEATETAAVMVKMVAMTVKVAVMLKTATMVEAIETAVAVDVTDGKGSGRRHIGGNAGS